jgi:voltage-gated potassium channel Kch
VIKFFFKEKFTILLGLLMVYVIVTPFFESIINQEIFLDVTFSAVMLSAILTLSREKKSRIAVILLVLPCFALIWFKLPDSSTEIFLAEAALQALFDFFMIVIIIWFVFHSPVITRDILSASIVAYLFVALFFANSFLVLEILSPGSFSIPNELIKADPTVLKYFSFVTLTTLGYGDVVPISNQAKTMVISEAFIGQIYLTVLIARLVGVYAAGQQKQKE